jgi:hypothetical protein
MVRRRSTVRFRNGAPGHEPFSNDANDRRGTSRKRRASAPMAAEPPMAQPAPGRQLLKVAASRPVQGSLVTVRQSHARQVIQRPGGFRPDEPHHHPGSDWRLLVSSGPAGQWSTSAWIVAASLGWEGDPRGQDADPPVHAVRVRHVLQLDRLRTLPSAFTHMPMSVRRMRGSAAVPHRAPVRYPGAGLV